MNSKLPGILVIDVVIADRAGGNHPYPHSMKTVQKRPVYGRCGNGEVVTAGCQIYCGQCGRLLCVVEGNLKCCRSSTKYRTFIERPVAIGKNFHAVSTPFKLRNIIA